MSSGNIVEIIGAVVDVQFPRASVPKVYDALKVGNGLTLEVQQQIGDGVVRTIAMGSTDGLQRGVGVDNTGAPISVPVGQKTLGRIMDVLGTPVDGAGDVGAEELWPIHRKAPGYVDQAAAVEILETGIKVIDLICPFNKGGKIGLFGAREWARPCASWSSSATSPSSTPASRCSPGSGSAPARATTSTTR